MAIFNYFSAAERNRRKEEREAREMAEGLQMLLNFNESLREAQNRTVGPGNPQQFQQNIENFIQAQMRRAMDEQIMAERERRQEHAMLYYQRHGRYPSNNAGGSGTGSSGDGGYYGDGGGSGDGGGGGGGDGGGGGGGE